MANTYLSRTPAIAGNRKTFTISFWLKRSDLNYFYFSGGGGSGVYFDSSGRLEYFEYSGGYIAQLTTNALFRDLSAWYHVVITYNSTEATASDRIKIWINGVLQTSFAFSTYPSLNLDSLVYNTTSAHNISYSNYLNGYLSHVHFIDGTAYDASAFGETDATTGIWKPITEPSVTYGTNGFFLKFENSANMDLDSSPNNLTFSTSGNLTQTVDTPSNVFATLNPLWNPNASITLSNGNLTQTVSGDFRSSATTLGASQGKWYAEYKATDVENFSVGITPLSGVFLNTTSNVIGQAGNGWGLIDNWGTVSYYYNTASTNTAITLSNGDIIMIAMDLDNSKVFFGKNGTWLDSGDPANGTNPAFSNVSSDDPIGFAVSCENANGSFNFGNGYFGTTAVSSATTDESGLGIFEYTVPSGYYALCTKNINEQEYD